MGVDVCSLCVILDVCVCLFVVLEVCVRVCFVMLEHVTWFFDDLVHGVLLRSEGCVRGLCLKIFVWFGCGIRWCCGVERFSEVDFEF